MASFVICTDKLKPPVSSLPLEQLKWFSWKKLNIFDCIELWKIPWQKFKLPKKIAGSSLGSSVAARQGAGSSRGKKAGKEKEKSSLNSLVLSFFFTTPRTCLETGSSSFFLWLRQFSSYLCVNKWTVTKKGKLKYPLQLECYIFVVASSHNSDKNVGFLNTTSPRF